MKSSDAVSNKHIVQFFILDWKDWIRLMVPLINYSIWENDIWQKNLYWLNAVLFSFI